MKKSREQHIQEILYYNPKAKNMEFGDLDRIKRLVRIEVTCTVCGHQWLPQISSLKHQGSGCLRCSKSGGKLSREEHIKDILDKNPKAQDMEFGEVFRDSSGSQGVTKIEVTCTVCGHQWTPRVSTLTYYCSGCPVCHKTAGFTREQHIKGIIERNPKAQNMAFGEITPLIDGHWRVYVTCIICGHQWTPRLSSLKKGTGCPVGQLRTNELMVYRFFKSRGYEVKSQVKFKNLPGHRFDVYLPDYGIIIEYDGEQHYVYPNYFHETPEEFNDQQSQDHKKNVWVDQQAGLHLERIRYDEDLEDRLNNILELLK